MSVRLYRLVVRDQAVLRSGRGVQRNTGAIAKLTGQSVSKPISLAPGEIRFEWVYAGDGAKQLAQSAEELFDASGYGKVPLFSTGADADLDGYYTLKSADKRPLDPATDRLYRVNGILRSAGTRRSSLRSVELTVDSVANDFGTTEEAFVGVPAAASLQRWYDERANTLTQATPADTVTTEFGDVNLYDVATAPSTTDAALVYDLPYEEQGKVDVRVWDDREQGLGAKTDAEGVVQYQKVFVTSHEYRGRPVCSNGRLRVLCDEDPTVVPGVTAERWDTANSTWSSVSLGSNPNDWRVIDVDVVAIGAAAVDAQLLFRNDSGTQHALNARLTRGDDTILWTNPPNEDDQTPTALRDVLDPIASTDLQTGGEALGLRAREEVRR